MYKLTFNIQYVYSPGMYVSIKRKGSTLKHSFGGSVKMNLGVNLKCCNRNTDICKICGTKPLGDYWHLKNEIFLCRPCMIKEYEKETKFKQRELEQFHVRFYFNYVHLRVYTHLIIYSFLYLL